MMHHYDHSPDDDRQAWFDLSCDLGRGMELLGWHIYNHLPEPSTPDMWQDVRYWDRWNRFTRHFQDELPTAIEEWCFSGDFPEMTRAATYLLQPRFYVAIKFIGNLYVGPGKYGETWIPFPRHIAPPNFRRWWLTDWFESNGHDLLFREMQLRFWTQHKSMTSPTARKQNPNARQATWNPPKYRPTTNNMKWG